MIAAGLLLGNLFLFLLLAGKRIGHGIQSMWVERQGCQDDQDDDQDRVFAEQAGNNPLPGLRLLHLLLELGDGDADRVQLVPQVLPVLLVLLAEVLEASIGFGVLLLVIAGKLVGVFIQLVQEHLLALLHVLPNAPNVIANLKYDTIIDLANLFGVDPCYLMGWSAPLHESGALQVTDEEMRLLAFFRSLNDIGKRKALENIGDLTQIEKYIRVAEGNRNAV